ncbi:MAG: hypothetical protein ACTSXV_01800 [Alphaproteobacteria bacterium]
MKLKIENFNKQFLNFYFCSLFLGGCLHVKDAQSKVSTPEVCENANLTEMTS